MTNTNLDEKNYFDNKIGSSLIESTWYYTKTVKAVLEGGLIKVYGLNENVPKSYEMKYAEIDIMLLKKLAELKGKVNMVFVSSLVIEAKKDSLMLFKKVIKKDKNIFVNMAVVEGSSGVLRGFCNAYLFIAGLSKRVKFFSSEKESLDWINNGN